MSLIIPRHDRRSRLWHFVALLAAFLLVGCDSAAPRSEEQTNNAAPAAPVRPPQLPQSEAETTVAARSTARTRTESATVKSADQLLWASPTSGKELNLAYLPPGIQAVVAWRPRATLESVDGKATFESLGHFAQELATQVETRLGFPLVEVDELLIGLLDGELTDAGFTPPKLALVATCREPIQVAELLPKWNSPTKREVSGETIYEGPENAWYLPAAGGGKCLVVAPQQTIADILDLNGAPPSLRNELQALLLESDRDRLLTLAFVPAFLSTGGKQLLVGALAPLREQLDWFLDNQALAVMISAHLGDDLFLETRCYTRPDVRSALLERELQTRLKASSQRLSEYLASGKATPYGAEVLDRFPQMWEQVVAHTRSGHQDRQVILRTVLPGVASHNLALAGNLALTELIPQGASVAATGETPESLTLEERLNRPISLSFPRQTLEQAIELFGREAGIEIEILGRDLQLEGITKNQSFGLDTKNLPAAAVLQKILQQASPDGKLIYVIQGDSAGGKARLSVTTRAAAARRGDTIPVGNSNQAEN